MKLLTLFSVVLSLFVLSATNGFAQANSSKTDTKEFPFQLKQVSSIGVAASLFDRTRLSMLYDSYSLVISKKNDLSINLGVYAAQKEQGTSKLFKSGPQINLDLKDLFVALEYGWETKKPDCVVGFRFKL